MTIHSDHPFVPPEDQRDPARRFRARLGGAVSLWTSGDGPTRVGLTVSSLLVADGEPAHVLALVDPESDLWGELTQRQTAVVQLLAWRHRGLADGFAGVAPAPGGAFRLGEWTASGWGPVLHGVSAWAGVRLSAAVPREVGWSVLVEAVIEHVELSPEGGADVAGLGTSAAGGASAEGSDGSAGVGDDSPLLHRRGRYTRFPADP